MTTLTLNDNIRLSKTNFKSVYELYDYIEEKFILPDLQFKSFDELDLAEKEELLKARNDNSKLINI